MRGKDIDELRKTRKSIVGSFFYHRKTNDIDFGISTHFAMTDGDMVLVVRRTSGKGETGDAGRE